jgi:hypothetical protein
LGAFIRARRFGTHFFGGTSHSARAAILGIGRRVDAQRAAGFAASQTGARSLGAFLAGATGVGATPAIHFVVLEVDACPRAFVPIGRAARAGLTTHAAAAEVDAQAASAREPRVAGVVAVTRAALGAVVAVVLVLARVVAAAQRREASERERNDQSGEFPSFHR